MARIDRTSIIGMNIDDIWLVSCRIGVPLARVSLMVVVTRVSLALPLICLVWVTKWLARPIVVLTIWLFGFILIGIDLLATRVPLIEELLVMMIVLAVTCLLGSMMNLLLMINRLTGTDILRLLCRMAVLPVLSPSNVAIVLFVCPPVWVLVQCLVSRKAAMAIVILKQTRFLANNVMID